MKKTKTRTMKELTPTELHQRTERDILRRYLGRYQASKRRKARLEERLAECRARTDSAGGGHGGDGTGGGSGMSLGRSSVADIVEMIADLEDDLRDQIKNINIMMFNVNKILAQLDEGSQEREVLEMRYIDGLDEDGICLELSVQRSTVWRYDKQGIDELLRIGMVRRTLAVTYPGEFYGKNPYDLKR